VATRSYSTHSYSPGIRVSLELLSLTQLGALVIGKPKGMPKPIKFILDKFSQGREEDRPAGYLSFKDWPKLLKFVPAKGARPTQLANHLRLLECWGSDNVAAPFWTLAERYLGLKVIFRQSVETRIWGYCIPII